MDDTTAFAFDTPAAPGRALSRPQKAAVIVRLLLAEGVDLSLADLPDEVQDELVLQMSRMRSVDHGTLAAVASEFAAEVDSIGLSFKRGISGALGTLGSAISPVAADRFRRQLGAEAMGDPWERIAALSTEDLLPLIEAESTEIGAVVLSKLKVSKAADVLGRLPGPQARRIAYAMSLTDAVRPAMVQRIGRTILDQIDARPVPAFTGGPVERVGAILNFSPASTRDDVLEGLDETDSDFADEVRKAIFTFANIPDRIDARDVAKIVRAVDQAVLITALQAAALKGRTKPGDFILANMSQRMAAQIREEMEALGKVKDKDGEDAMSAVVATIRELEAAGEIFLIAGED
jgi:flagellar motor switch protein FliG